MYHQYQGDAHGYYMYLPAFFIHHDLADFHTTMTAKLNHCSPGQKADRSYQNKYFIGTAIFQAPFFLAAHALAGYVHQARDGYSMIYMYAAVLSCMTYGLAGLFLLSILLRRRFSDGVTASVLIILALATNLYYLIVAQPPFCHTYLFFLYALLLWVTVRFWDTMHRYYLLYIGLICGMIILTRFNEVYVVLIPLLWGIRTRRDLSVRMNFLKTNIGYVLAASGLMILCLAPQVLYWKISSGHYLIYSYGGESFNFLHPRIWEGLTGGNNGWLAYCPIMILAVIGIWSAARDRHPALIPIAVFIPIHVYVIYSWWCWFYMGSYGSRPMTEAHTLLCFPLAYSVEWLWASWLRRLIVGAVIAFCSWLVMFQTYQGSLGFFNSELSNWHFNIVSMGKTSISDEDFVVLDTKEFQPSLPVFNKLLGQNDFEDTTMAGSDASVFLSGRRSLCVRMDQTSIGYSATLAQTGAKPGQWIKATISALAKEPVNHTWHLSSLYIACTRKGTYTKWRNIGIQNKIDNPTHQIWHYPINKWGKMYFYSQIPDNMTPTDTIKVYVEHKNGPDVYVDDLKVELYNTK